VDGGRLARVPSLNFGEEKIKALIEKGEEGWHLFDVRGNRVIWPSGSDKNSN
jgi:hypothetical protein